ncbi:hypothetical protein GVAV_002308 [Gurleya vavrai]
MRTKIFSHTSKSKQTSSNSQKTVSKHPSYYLPLLSTPMPIPPIEKLNLELFTLYKQLLPTIEELNIRSNLTKMMQKFIKDILPDFEFHVFGSSRSFTYLPNSDIDIVLVKEGRDVIPNKILNYIASKAEFVNFLDRSHILHIRQARVPLLKLRDKTYGIEFDIVINKQNSLQQADFILNEIEKKPFLKSMCILLKYFLKARNLSESRFGGLCSYAQFLMLLSFCQLHPIIQQNFINPNKNLGVFFMDFFQFYGCDFQYETVTISVKDACYFKKSISNAIISLEDPVDIKHDVGDNCIQMYSIKEVFQHDYRIMNIVIRERIQSRDSLLGLWMTYDLKQDKWRKANIEKYKRN